MITINKKVKKFLNVFKWLSLVAAISFSLASCVESFVSSDKTVDQVESITPGTDTSKLVELKDFNIELDHKNEDKTYYCNDVITFSSSFMPINASHKTLSYKVNNNSDGVPLAKVDFKTNEILCLEIGHVVLDFYVEEENEIGFKTIEFDIIPMPIKVFDVEYNNISIKDKDLLFGKLRNAKPKTLDLKIDPFDLAKNYLKIAVDKSDVIQYEIKDKQLIITPIGAGNCNLTLSLDNKTINIYIGVDNLVEEDFTLNNNQVFPIHANADIITYTYLNVSNVNTIDLSNLKITTRKDSVIDFLNPYLFTLGNQIELKTIIKKEAYDRVFSLKSDEFIDEVVDIKYEFPGGKIISPSKYYNRSTNTFLPLEKIVYRIYAPIDLEYKDYVDFPDEIKFGYLKYNNKVYHQDYFHDFVIDKKITEYVNYNRSTFAFEEIGSNDLIFSKSKIDKLVINLKNKVTPKHEYKVRFYFNRFNKTNYKDFKVLFIEFNNLKDDEYIFDFNNVYGEFDKINGIVPTNYAIRDHGLKQFEKYEIRRRNKEIAPELKGGGMILELLNDDIKLTKFNFNKEKNPYPNSYYNSNYTYYYLMNCSKPLNKILKFRVTSPVFDFFDKEPQWTYFEIYYHDGPEFLDAIIEGKNYKIENDRSTIIDYPNELNVGESINLKLKPHDYNSVDYGYKFFKTTKYGDIELSNFKNLKFYKMTINKKFTNFIPDIISYKNGIVANYYNNVITANYPGLEQIAFGVTKLSEDNYDYNFKLNVKVKGTPSKINIKTIKPLNYSDGELPYCKNDLSNNLLRVGSKIKIGDFDSLETFNNDISIISSNSNIIKVHPNTNVIEGIKEGKAKIFVKYKKYPNVFNEFTLTVTNSTSDFEILKNDFIDLKEENGDKILIAHVKKNYRISIKKDNIGTSKYLSIKEPDNDIIDIKDGGLIYTKKGGDTILQIIYGDQEKGEVPFVHNIKVSVIDNSQAYNDFVYFIRKLFGHFGLNCFIGLSVTSYLILLLYDKKKLNYLILPITLIYSCGMALLSEVIQHFVPTRCFAWSDVTINTMGAVTGISIMFGLYLLIILILYLVNKYDKKVFDNFDKEETKN